MSNEDDLSAAELPEMFEIMFNDRNGVPMTEVDGQPVMISLTDDELQTLMDIARDEFKDVDISDEEKMERLFNNILISKLEIAINEKKKENAAK